MKISYLFLTLLVIVSAVSCSDNKTLTNEEKEWLENNPGLTVAVFPKYPPYQYINSDGEIDGIFIDFFSLIEKKINYKFTKKYYKNWEPIIDDAKKGNIDVLLEIQDTEKRRAFLNFTPPILTNPHVIVGKKEIPDNTGIEYFYGKKVSVGRKYAIHEYLKTNHNDLVIDPKLNDVICLDALRQGKVEAYIGQKGIAAYLLDKLNTTDFKIISEVNYINSLGFATKKELTILNNILTKTVNNITDTEKKEITENWLFSIVTPYYKTVQFWFFFTLIILLFLAVIVATNYYLKFKIKQRSEELLITKEVADESNQLKTNFISNIPYEIQTPMNGIIELSKYLNDESITEEERKRYTQMIINSSQTLISIVDNVLEVSKLQTKAIAIKLTEVNISSILENLFSFYEIKAKEKNLSISLNNNIDTNDHVILVDRPKLNKILNPLVQNAIKYTDIGSIIISCTIKDELLNFSIKDTGSGIRKQHQQKIKESLAQKDVVLIKDLKGLGFGLTIAKRNADFIGGEITFDSTMDKETIFTLTIPHIKPSKTIPLEKNIDNTLITSSNKEKHIILIAEDVETNFLYLKTILSKMDSFEFIIYRAKNGKEAIKICEQHQNIDLVLMDIKMPVMDGYDATRYIKKMRPNLTIIAQTAYSIEEDVEKALAAGCDDFISKPVDKKLLTSIFKKYFSVLKKNK